MRPDQLSRIAAVLDAEDTGFAALLRLAGLDPRQALRGRNLRNARFGADDLTGWDLRGADLTGATHDHAFAGAIIDADTTMPYNWRPAGFDLHEIHRRILAVQSAPPFWRRLIRWPSSRSTPAAEPVPLSWRPFVLELDFGSGSNYLDEAAKPAPFDNEKNRINPLILRAITPIAGLANLQSLNLWNTQVSDLAPIAGLANLQFLDLRGTQVGDLTPIANLPNLQSLDLRSTQVRDLAPIANLANLQYLDLNNTPVTDASMLRHPVENLRLPKGCKPPPWYRGT